MKKQQMWKLLNIIYCRSKWRILKYTTQGQKKIPSFPVK